MTLEKKWRLAIGRNVRSRDFLMTWVLPLIVILGILALYVATEHRIYFYDPRGFQEVAMGASAATRRGPYELLEWLRAQSLGEYPPYWSLPLVVLPPEVLNLRVPYEIAMGALGLLPLSVFTTKIACRIFGLRVSPWMVLVAGLNPLAFLVCVQGVPDLIGMALILAACWILISRRMERSTLFWALLVGALALLVKKNFLFDLTAVVACYMLAYAVAAVRYRHPPERWRNLLTEVLSPRVLFAAAVVVAGTAILTPGTLSSIFGRDNSLFYGSYQTSLGFALSSNLSYAGGFVAIALAGTAVGALAAVIARRTSPSVTRNAVFVATFLIGSEILWAFVQKQAGIIHQVHVWPMLMMLGFVGLVRVVQCPRPVMRQGIALALATVLFVFMFAPVPALNGLRMSASRMPAGMYPNVTEPFVQTNFNNLITMATTIRTLSATDGPVLVPIASTAFNSSLLYQAYVQQVGNPLPDIYQTPQVDLRDALPWSTLIGDDGRIVLVSRDWVPDLPDGHRNLQAMNEFLDSPAAQTWIKSSQPLDAGVPGQLSDLRVVHLVIPEADALTFAAAVQPFLPVADDRGLQGAVALLTDHDRRTEGPSAQTPTAWNVTAGSLSKPTRLLVEGTATDSISLGVANEGCDGLSYEWTVLGQFTTIPAVAGFEASEGKVLPGATQVLHIPRAGKSGRPWSHVLTLGVDGETTGCQVSVSLAG
jgi:hypothetical protein